MCYILCPLHGVHEIEARLEGGLCPSVSYPKLLVEFQQNLAVTLYRKYRRIGSYRSNIIRTPHETSMEFIIIIIIIIIVIGWTIGVIGFHSRRGLGVFLFTTSSRTALGPIQPPVQWVPGALSLGVTRPGREVANSHPFSAEVKE
jgi:hypothetical protein